MNNFEFQTVFTNDVTKNVSNFIIFLRFWHFLFELGLSKCFRSTQCFKTHQRYFLNYFYSYFRSLVTQDKEIPAKNGCGRAKTACSPWFFKLGIFSSRICLDILQTTQKNGARHDRKKFSFFASV